MKRPRQKTYKKALLLAFGITFLLYFFLLLLLSGFDMFSSGFANPIKPEKTDRYLLLYRFLMTYLFFAMEFIIVFRIQRNARRYRIGVITAAVFVTAIIYGTVTILIGKPIFGYEDLSIMILGTMISTGFLSLVVILLGYTDHVIKKQETTALENETLKTQNLQSRYEALKNQIDPHFLFNTFSSLTSIIEVDPVKAQEFSIKMSSVLRYTLQNKDVVTLVEELDFTKDYCLLMQIRYDENLTINFDIDESYYSYYVAPLSIQTLIENAIKHNEISNRSPLTISVHTNIDKALTVSNCINPKKNDIKGTGLGLANLSERYMLKWQREIQIYSNEKIFMVSIPLIPPKK